MTTSTDPDTLCINTIRTLAMDAVQAAGSGHPGTPMALAPVGYVLWQRFLRFDPTDPIWPNRDRFVLSNGHASMLLYALLHLAGVRAVDPDYEVLGQPAVSLDDIRHFRAGDSRAPGHPEYRLTSGVETTTGPLGQGTATSVGMAAAGAWLAARYNRPGHTLFDFDVYTLLGDGDMMEGITAEAASLAGHLGLANLCWLYDNNQITIEGSTELAFSEDVAQRFTAAGWRCLRVGDANDLIALSRALEEFRATADQPTLIIVDSHIGYGAPHKQDTADAHGEPLGADEVRAAKRFYGWPEDAAFVVPQQAYDHFAAGVGTRGRAARESWERTLASYRTQWPALADEIDLMQRRALPDGWDADLPVFPPADPGPSSRESSGQVLNHFAARVPWLLGGAADLSPSTKTTLVDAGSFERRRYHGRNFHFGIREHGMCAFANGLALCKLRPFAAGFFIFTDYARGAIRLSALMELPVVYLWTHDSISLGQDGPTHQPVEQLASFRAMPGMTVIRPADANEVVQAWRVALDRRHFPVMLVLSRQGLRTFDRARFAPAELLARGGYVLADPPDGAEPEVILIGTGSEVALCVDAYEQLTAEGTRARVVSMPSFELFERQDEAYREQVLPNRIRARVAVEQAGTYGWERYVGLDGVILGMRTFGASAPLKVLLEQFGFLPDHVVQAAHQALARSRDVYVVDAQQ